MFCKSLPVFLIEIGILDHDYRNSVDFRINRDGCNVSFQWVETQQLQPASTRDRLPCRKLAIRSVPIDRGR